MWFLLMESSHANLFLTVCLCHTEECGILIWRRKGISSLQRLLRTFPMDIVPILMLLESWMEWIHHTNNKWSVCLDGLLRWVVLIYWWCTLIWHCLVKVIWRTYIIYLLTSRSTTNLKWYFIQVKSMLNKADFRNNAGSIQPMDVMILRMIFHQNT